MPQYKLINDVTDCKNRFLNGTIVEPSTFSDPEIFPKLRAQGIIVEVKDAPPAEKPPAKK